MAFSKFKLSKSGQRTTPVPIAAAIPQPSSRNDTSYLAPDTKIIDNDHTSLVSTRDQASGYRKRQYPGVQNKGNYFDSEYAPLESNSEGRQAMSNDKRRCKVNPGVETSICESPAAVSNGRDLLIAQPLSIEASGPVEYRVSGVLKVRSSIPDRSPHHDKTGIFDPPSLKRKMDYMVDHFFSPSLAKQAFDQYMTKLLPTCPVVVFPSGATAMDVRKTKPWLFMAILSVAASGLCTPDQHRQFAFKARNLLVEAAIFEGEKSIELVQALLVVSFWYRAPENFARSNQNQLVSVTLSMAIDVGLDRVTEPRAPLMADDKWNRAEAQRTWLGCFLLCTSLSLIMRRPNPISWTQLNECYLNDVRKSAVSPTDDFFSKIITSEHVCYLANAAFSLSNPNKSVTLEPKTIQTIEDLHTRAEGLSPGQDNSLQNALVEFGRLASLLYIHEAELHFNHNIDEFKAPFSTRSLKSSSFIDMHWNSNSTHFTNIGTIIQAAQGLLDAFIGLSTADMLALPPHIYAGRVIYAVILLMKLHKALSVRSFHSDGDIAADKLRLEEYIERLLLISKRLLEEDPGSSLSRAFLIMSQLKSWLSTDTTLDESGNSPANNSRAKPSATNTNQAQSSGTLETGFEGQPHGGAGRLETPESQTNQVSLPGAIPQNTGDVLNRDIVSDSWFWEFFNVDMLH